MVLAAVTAAALGGGVAVGVTQGLIPWPPQLGGGDATEASLTRSEAEQTAAEDGTVRGERDGPDASGTERARPAARGRERGRRPRSKPVSFKPLAATLGWFGESVQELPNAAGVRSARRYLDRREGQVSFAALAPGGKPFGQGLDTGYPSASLSKAMLLAARLRQLEEGSLDDATRAQLEPMIEISDNEAANAVYSTVGDDELAALADDAGMTSFEPAYWPDIELTPADQARFFLRLDRLVPREHRRYALDLLSSVSPDQSWGIPEAAEPRWRAFFKGGWRPEEDGWIVHQAARLLDREENPVAIAVLSRGNPSYEYGQETIEGVTARLVGRK